MCNSRPPPPSWKKTILKFHSDFLHPSLRAQTKLDDNVIQIQNLPTWATGRVPACTLSVLNHLTFTSLLV